MKQLNLLLIATLFCYNLNAQSDSSIIQKSQYIIANLDTTQIPYLVLYDMVSPLSQLNIHNGQNDSAISSPVHFQQAYFEYFQSMLNKSSARVPKDVISQMDTFTNNIHPIGMLFAKYATIKTNAISDSLLTMQNGQLYNVAGANTPYARKTATVISALTSGVSLDTGWHYFQLNGDFILGNNLPTINKITFQPSSTDIQIRDVKGVSMSNYRNIQPFRVHLNGTGLYTVNMIIELADATTIGTKFIIDVETGSYKTTICDTCIVIGGCDGGDQLQITGDIYSPLADYGITPTAATGTAYIFYADANCATHTITKPVIFLDGYDASNGRDAPRIYSRYINHEFIVPPNQTVKLADYMRSQGYDLIILDFGDGGTFIENNAMVVSKLIQTLYAQHGATMIKDFVVIGPSMGSLIAQFALAYMETNSIPHHTRLFTSFDGPHQGANVAIGMQELIEYSLQSNTLNAITGGKLDELKHNLIENPAARQMLVHHYSAQSLTPQADAMRTVFLSHLAAQNTYPQNLRKIAVINGNKSAALNPNLITCNRFTKLEHHLYTPPLVIPNPIWWLPPVIIPPINQSIDWRVYATSGTTSCKSASFLTFWPLGNLIGGIPFGTTQKFAAGLAQGGSYDVCPGSNFGVDFTDPQKSLDKYLGWLPFSSFDLTNTNNFTFIPTTSAVDYIQPTPININADLTNVVLGSCAGTTPFDRVYANNFRTNHVDVDGNIAKAFLNEIEENVSDWDITTTPITISATTVCDGQSVTLSTPNIPVNSNVQWSTLNNSFSYGSQGSTTTTATKNIGGPNGVTNFYINANSSCGKFIGQKSIQAGKPFSPSPTISIASTANCYKWDANVAFPAPPTGSTYSWGVGIMPNCNCFVSGSNAGVYSHLMINGQELSWSSSATNSCGTEDNDGQILELVVTDCNPYTAHLNFVGIPLKKEGENGIKNTFDDIILFPNPSSTYWMISIMDNSITKFSYTLLDITGKNIKSGEYNNISLNDVKIDNGYLSKGTYILNIITNNKNYSYKLIKE